MSKTAEAFRTISEVAAELAVPKHVLRFWEAKFPQIRPMKRGGGRRYYRPGDMELLRGIRHLLHAEGYTIKGVQKILREQGVDAVKQPVQPQVAAVRVPKGRKSARTARDNASSSSPAPPVTTLPRNASPSERVLIEQMISELEACRDLLVKSPAATPSARPARRARAARG